LILSTALSYRPGMHNIFRHHFIGVQDLMRIGCFGMFLLFLVLSGLARSEASTSRDCTRFISPSGGGNGLASGSPYRVADFLAEAQEGYVGCMENGVYSGSASMVTPPRGRSGVSENPITLRAMNDGHVTVDGEFVRGRLPLSFEKNDWWVIEGINFARAAAVMFIASSSHNVFRRVIAYDGSLTTNDHIVSVAWNSAENVFEDFAVFGPGRYTMMFFSGSHHNTCRRCWGRHEGSITDSLVGPKATFLMSYESASHTNTCENCLATWHAISMPESFRYTTYDGTESPLAWAQGGSGYTIQHNVGMFLTSCTTGATSSQNTKVLGTISYVLPSDHISIGSGPTATFVDRDCHGQTVRDFVSYVPPSGFPGASSISMLLGDLDSRGGNVMEQSTAIYPRGAAWPFQEPSTWHIINYQAGNSISSVNSVWSNTGDGANLCYRYIDGTLTEEKLWPWPMNERIKQATGNAGAYAGPCLQCTGGRFARTPVDVTADLESILGPIPTTCRN